jgi:hypothetical protein
LLEHAAARRLRRYRIYHGRSHLVLYEDEQGSRLVNRGRIAEGRIRAKKSAT